MNNQQYLDYRLAEIERDLAADEAEIHRLQRRAQARRNAINFLQQLRDNPIAVGDWVRFSHPANTTNFTLVGQVIGITERYLNIESGGMEYSRQPHRVIRAHNVVPDDNINDEDNVHNEDEDNEEEEDDNNQDDNQDDNGGDDNEENDEDNEHDKDVNDDGEDNED